MVIIPHIFSELKNIKAFQSTRLGGQSKGIFGTMNLGLSSGDDVKIVLENRRILFESQNLDIKQVATIKQIHSDTVISVKIPGHHSEADGMITAEKNLYLSVSCADCASVLLADRAGKAVAAVHSGWRGTHRNITNEAIQSLYKQYGVESKELLAWVGPCIGPKAFEVGEDVFEKFPEKYFVKNESRWLFDMRSVISDQLLESGIPVAQIEISSHCTYLDSQKFYSWRRDRGETGRLWSVIGICG